MLLLRRTALFFCSHATFSARTHKSKHNNNSNFEGHSEIRIRIETHILEASAAHVQEAVFT